MFDFVQNICIYIYFICRKLFLQYTLFNFNIFTQSLVTLIILI